MIQVGGGCNLVRKTLAAFLPPTAKHTVLLDLHGYDGWPALAALEAQGDGG